MYILFELFGNDTFYTISCDIEFLKQQAIKNLEDFYSDFSPDEYLSEEFVTENDRDVVWKFNSGDGYILEIRKLTLNKEYYL